MDVPLKFTLNCSRTRSLEKLPVARCRLVGMNGVHGPECG